MHDVAAGKVAGGQALDSSTRERYEAELDIDLADVRIHDGPVADSAARRHEALAYTVGDDVVFRTGGYRPSTREGQELLRHELTHVAQQRLGGPPPGAAHEQQARAGDAGSNILGSAVGVACFDDDPASVGSRRHPRRDFRYAFVFPRDEYGRLARRWARTYYSGYRIVSARTLQDVFRRIDRDLRNVRDAHVAEVVLITHANEAGEMPIPIRNLSARERAGWDSTMAQREAARRVNAPLEAEEIRQREMVRELGDLDRGLHVTSPTDRPTVATESDIDPRDATGDTPDMSDPLDGAEPAGYRDPPALPADLAFSSRSLRTLAGEFAAGHRSEYRQQRERVVMGLMDSDTRIVVRGCRFGTSTSGMRALSDLFGGSALVAAPTMYQGFEFGPRGRSWLGEDADSQVAFLESHAEALPLPMRRRVSQTGEPEDARAYLRRAFPGGIPVTFFLDERNHAMFDALHAQRRTRDMWRDDSIRRQVRAAQHPTLADEGWSYVDSNAAYQQALSDEALAAADRFEAMPIQPGRVADPLARELPRLSAERAAAGGPAATRGAAGGPAATLGGSMAAPAAHRRLTSTDASSLSAAPTASSPGWQPDGEAVAEIVRRALELQAVLDRLSPESPRARHIARTLIRAYRGLDAIIRRVFTSALEEPIHVAGLRWDPGSPLEGQLEAIPPFGNLDVWYTIAEDSHGRRHRQHRRRDRHPPASISTPTWRPPPPTFQPDSDSVPAPLGDQHSLQLPSWRDIRVHVFEALLGSEPVIGPPLALLITALNVHGYEVNAAVVGVRASADWMPVGIGWGGGVGVDAVMFFDVADMSLRPDLVPFAEIDAGATPLSAGLSVLVGLRISPRGRSGDARASYEGGSVGGTVAGALRSGSVSIGQGLLHGQEGWAVTAYGLSGGGGAFASYSYGFSVLRDRLTEVTNRIQALPGNIRHDVGQELP